MCATVVTRPLRARQKVSFGIVPTLDHRPQVDDDGIKLDRNRGEENGVRKGPKKGATAGVGGFCVCREAERMDDATMTTSCAEFKSGKGREQWLSVGQWKGLAVGVSTSGCQCQ